MYMKDPSHLTFGGVDLTDHVLDRLNEEDPDWNNAVVHGFDTVAKHDMFWTYLWDEGFDSDNPPTVCAHYCGKNKDERDNEE